MALRAVPDHPKFANLKAILGQPKGPVLGWLEAIWHFTGRFTPQGNIGKYPDETIEAWVEWSGKPGDLIAALIHAGWLDADPTHRLLVHDWEQHADHATKMGLGRNRLSFCAHTVQKPCAQISSPDNAERTPEALPVPVPAPESVPVPVPEARAKAKATAKGKPSLFVLPEWIPEEVWKDFEEMRRKKRAPLTDRARQNIVAKLVRLETEGQRVEDVLNQSITNAWQDVFPLRDENKGGVRPNEAANESCKHSSAKQRVDANRAALKEAVKRRGLDGVDNAGRPDGGALSESGFNGIDRGLPTGLRASGPEILHPAIPGRARRFEDQARAGFLSPA
jgi:hypothetical protein